MKQVFLVMAALLWPLPLAAGPAEQVRPPEAAPASPSAATMDEAGLAATQAKFNAYIAFMNRTIRAIDSLDRYKSWVNWKTGPTGRERYISYGLYSVYDVRDERRDAEAALAAKPSLPELDEAMRAYVTANDRLAPILNKANGYYSRADYKVDKLAEGKALHPQIVEAGETFLAARARLESVMRVQKHALDEIRLATIEKKEGRDVHWHVTNVMMHAKETLDVLTDGDGKKPVDMTAFDTDMAGFGTAVKAMDDYAAEHPGAFSAFGSFPDSMLGRMREVQGRLARARGNLRRAAGMDMTFILSDYNTMVTTARTATMFNR